MELQRANRASTFSDADFRMFAELLACHCGLHYGEDLRYILERRVRRRMEALGLGSVAAYHYLLRHDPAKDEELSRLVDEVTTNETYFLRERRQLTALIEEIVPELLASRNGEPIHIWSAGCSSGEEPYSIVILAMEAGLQPGRDLHVYASDISRSMLQRARRGEYRETSFRETEAPLRKRYFVEKDGAWRISDQVKRHVSFAHLNLIDQDRVGLLGPMDVILCRNVIIYFDVDTKRRVIDRFEERLRPGGYLLLGHAESLINLSSSFELCHLRHDLVYRKPAPGDSPRAWPSSLAGAARAPQEGRA